MPRSTNLYFFPIFKEQPISLLTAKGRTQSTQSTLCSDFLQPLTLPDQITHFPPSPLALRTSPPSFCPPPPNDCPLSGGGERDRTDDPLLAKQVLSQLSYTPSSLPRRRLPPSPSLVGLDGLEPSTPALSRRCSNQLSYRPTRQVTGNRLSPDAQPIGCKHCLKTLGSPEPRGYLVPRIFSRERR